MENLEQYTVLADYNRKDSHQVNLTEGQVVHVIEKHDTGEPTPSPCMKYLEMYRMMCTMVMGTMYIEAQSEPKNM